jgi:hypothetical protein
MDDVSEIDQAIKVTLRAYLEMLTARFPTHPATICTREMLNECNELLDPGSHILDKARRMEMEGVTGEDSVQITIARDLWAISRGKRLPRSIGYYFYARRA